MDMKTTVDRYNKLCDNNIVDKSRYDLNRKIGLFLE